MWRKPLVSINLRMPIHSNSVTSIGNIPECTKAEPRHYGLRNSRRLNHLVSSIEPIGQSYNQNSPIAKKK